MAAKPSESQLKELMQRFLDEWRSEEQIYKMFVKKWWINRDEEIEKRFEQERTLEQEEQPAPEVWPEGNVINDVEEVKNTDDSDYNAGWNDLADKIELDWWEEEIDRDGWDALQKWLRWSMFARPAVEYLKKKLWKKTVKTLVKTLWKWIKKYTTKAWKNLVKWIKAPWYLELAVNWLVSFLEAKWDREEWLTKDDAFSMASDFVDNFLFDIPSAVTHLCWETPWWENKTVWEQQAQVQKIKKDEETLDKYDDLNWWWFRWRVRWTVWNALWTDALEWWYLSESKRIKDNFWWDWEMDAEQQISAYAAWNNKENNSKLKKDIINKWYKYKTVRDKETWEKYQTWVDDEWNTLLNEKQLLQVGKKDNSNFKWENPKPKKKETKKEESNDKKDNDWEPSNDSPLNWVSNNVSPIWKLNWFKEYLSSKGKK